MNRHTLLLIILTAGVYFHTNAQTRNPADFKGPISLSMVQTTNAQVGISGDGGLLIQTEGTDPRIQVNAPSGAWDLRNKTFITMNVSNLGETEIRLSCTLGDHSWNQGLLILNPGEQGKLNVIIKGVPLPEDHPLARNFIRMRGLPGGYVWHWVPFDPAHVEKISFTLI